VDYFIIFTDLDGTLLDHDTYEWEEAMPALNMCRDLHVPVILVSSKTRAEMDHLRRKLSISSPFITENGGGIFFPGKSLNDPPPKATFDKGMWRWSLGLPYPQLVKGLHEIRDELGCDIKGFSDMSIKDISRLTGLDDEASRLASMREYDEPFIVADNGSFDRKGLYEAAARRGLTVTEGGRFFHLQGMNDKGQAMERVISWYKKLYKKVVSVALGDSPNDYPMLERADHPVLVGAQKDYSAFIVKVPRLRVSPKPGPGGWNTIVLEILREKEEAGNVGQL
jgi:mannosyl-3-phosphoglycerate phosphatase